MDGRVQNRHVAGVQVPAGSQDRRLENDRRDHSLNPVDATMEKKWSRQRHRVARLGEVSGLAGYYATEQIGQGRDFRLSPSVAKHLR